MRRGLYSVVAGALLIGSAGHAGAQDTDATAGGATDFASVIGISKGDLLNIRAAASPTGMVIARIPNGTLVKVVGCGAAGGNLWCSVEDANDPAAKGWTPARYLSGYEDKASEVAAGGQAPSVDELSIMSGNATFAANPAKARADARAKGVVASFYSEPLPPPEAAVPGAEAAGASGVEVETSERDIIGGPAVAPLIALPVVPGEGSDLAPAKAETDLPQPEAPQTAAVSDVPPAGEGDAQPVLEAEEKPAGQAPGSDDSIAASPGAAQGYTVLEPKKVTVSKIEPEAAAPEAAAAPQPSAAQIDEVPAVNVPAPAAAPEQSAPAGTTQSASRESGDTPLAAASEVPADTAAEEEPLEDKSAFRSIADALLGLVGGEDEPAEETASLAPAADEADAVPGIVEAPDVVAATTGSTSETGGEIPCARYLGQPMAMCRASVVREGAQTAAVTVSWPDGGRRVIRFRDGRMEGSDSAQPFRAVREADLNMIRIGKTERFEIPDALAFGG